MPWHHWVLAPPPWEFLTGLLAVGAAIYVGIKQVRISEALKNLQESQSRADIGLKRQANQLALLDRRSDCIARFRAIWSEWMANGHLTPDEVEQLRRVLLDAELVFPSDIADDIEKVFHSSRLRGYWEKRTEQFRNEYSDKYKKYLEKIFQAEDETNEKMPDLLRRMVAAAKTVEAS